MIILLNLIKSMHTISKWLSYLEGTYLILSQSWLILFSFSVTQSVSHTRVELDKWNVDCWFSQEIKDKIQHEKADMHHTKHQIY